MKTGRMNTGLVILTAAITLAGTSLLSYAGAVSAGGKVIREIAEELAEQAGKQASREFVEATTVQLGKIASKCGDDALDVISKHGMVAMRVFQSAGDDAGPYLVKAIRLYGDDAIRVAQTSAGRTVLRQGSDTAIRAVARHTDSVIPLLQRYGDDGANALVKLSPANGRRLQQLADEGMLPPQRMKEILETIGKYGDKAMVFLWRHHKLLATATVLTAFVSDPEPYLNGVKDITKVVAAPIATGIGKGIQESATAVAKGVGEGVGKGLGTIKWNLWLGIIMAIVGLRQLFKRRKSGTAGKTTTDSKHSIDSGK